MHLEVLHNHVVAHSAPLVKVLEVVKHVTRVLISDSVDLQSISIMKKQAFSDLSNLCKLKMVIVVVVMGSSIPGYLQVEGHHEKGSESGACVNVTADILVVECGVDPGAGS